MGHYFDRCRAPDADAKRARRDFPFRGKQGKGKGKFNGNGSTKRKQANVASQQTRGTKRAVKRAKQEGKAAIKALMAHYGDSISSGGSDVGSGGDAPVSNPMDLPVVRQFMGLVATPTQPTSVSHRLSKCIGLGLFTLKDASVYIVDSGCAIVASWDKNDFKPGSLKPATCESLSGVGDELHSASFIGTLSIASESGALIEIENAWLCPTMQYKLIGAKSLKSNGFGISIGIGNQDYLRRNRGGRVEKIVPS